MRNAKLWKQLIVLMMSVMLLFSALASSIKAEEPTVAVEGMVLAVGDEADADGFVIKDGVLER